VIQQGNGSRAKKAWSAAYGLHAGERANTLAAFQRALGSLALEIPSQCANCAEE